MKSLDICLIACALGLVLPSLAAGPSAALTPARYFECQIAARQTSLAGMRERQGLQQVRAAAAQLERAEINSRSRVELAFHRCGYGPGVLAAYAHRHQEEIKTWLLLNPQTGARMANAGRDIDAQVLQMGDNPGRRSAR